MSAVESRRASAPSVIEPETLVCSPSNERRRVAHAYVFTERVTVDLPPKLRSRIKAVARERDQSVAQMLRALLRREFSESGDRAGGGAA